MSVIIPSPKPPWHRLDPMPKAQKITGPGDILSDVEVAYLEKEAGGGPVDVTLSNGSRLRASIRIFVPKEKAATTATFRIHGTFSNCQTILFNDLANAALLEWDGTSWHVIGGNPIQE